jgi:hypothetical protein
MKTLLLFLLFSSAAFAQEEDHKEESNERKHSISALLSHTYVSEAVLEGKISWRALPSIVLDYNYTLSHQWKIGWHNDLVLENFVVERLGGRSEIERKKPLASTIVAGFKPGNHFTYEIGFGGEFETEESFFLTRLGVEYSLEIKENLEFVSNFIYDIKWNAYDSFAIGVGLSKSFGK